MWTATSDWDVWLGTENRFMKHLTGSKRHYRKTRLYKHYVCICRCKGPICTINFAAQKLDNTDFNPKNRDVGIGLRKIVACSQPYLVVPS